VGPADPTDDSAGRAADAGNSSVIGFVDMADFTGFTRRSTEAQLREVLDDFEELAATCVSEHHGQIVKTIGDEILYIADDPANGAQIAAQLVQEAAQQETVPPLRAGVAYGPVLRRLGDVFGQTVNIASRLVSIARPDSVLIDQRLAEELASDERFRLSAMRPVAVRGYRHLHPARLRLADGPDAARR
jgi:adenylate cyclase